MSNKPAKSKGNFSRRSNLRNGGLPDGVRRARGSTRNRLDGASDILAKAGTLYEYERRAKMLRRWKVQPNLLTD